ncbi:MAG: hypothetical protein LBM04_00735 [Opitutaceae bacterium]|nr:hypothetical protein [Opitutaceae bacterium]
MGWIVYTFAKPEAVPQASIYWADGGPRGRHRCPLSWKLEYKRADGQWADVHAKSGYAVEKDTVNTVEFEKVETGAIRLSARLSEKYTTGIYEFEVK